MFVILKAKPEASRPDYGTRLFPKYRVNLVIDTYKSYFSTHNYLKFYP